MREFVIYILLFFVTINAIEGQVVIPYGPNKGSIMPEHGFLPGKDFKFYSTIYQYDFSGLKFRVELFDDRDSLKLHYVDCSRIDFTNTSEFTSPNCILKVKQYLELLFKNSGAIIDSTSNDILQVRLEGIDVRLIGFLSIRVHGLCQMKIKYHDFVKTYCVDITDADKHSPVSSNAWVTRKTATRILASAAMREVIEQFFIDLKSLR